MKQKDEIGDMSRAMEQMRQVLIGMVEKMSAVSGDLVTDADHLGEMVEVLENHSEMNSQTASALSELGIDIGADIYTVDYAAEKILEFMKVQYVCGFSCERSLSAVTLLPIFKKFKNISVSQNKTSTFAEV